MHTPSARITLATLILACLAPLAPLVHAQTAPPAAGPQAGDPARWYQADSTPQAQLRTLQKEIGAALAEAKKACRQEAPASRASCLKEAQATYQQDMANAHSLRDAAHPK